MLRDRVKGALSGCGSGSLVAEAVEEPVEELLASDQALVGGVVALALQRRSRLEGWAAATEVGDRRALMWRGGSKPETT